MTHRPDWLDQPDPQDVALPHDDDQLREQATEFSAWVFAVIDASSQYDAEMFRIRLGHPAEMQKFLNSLGRHASVHKIECPARLAAYRARYGGGLGASNGKRWQTAVNLATLPRWRARTSS